MIKTIVVTFGAMAAGAALMYIFDPQGGRRRRALVRDKAVGIKNDVKGTVERTATDLGNRAQGMLHEAKSVVDNRLTEDSSPSQSF